jgi:hypothetical protein
MLTLCKRLWNKENIFNAHRSHYYQRAIANGFSVPQVSGRVFALGLLLAVLGVGAAIMQSLLADVGLFLAGALATLALLHSFAHGRK